MLDLDEGQISFLLNGEDLGIAFTNVPQDIPWYPAVSLAASQGCRFYFGNASGPVKYAPDGYTIFSFVGQDISPPEPKSLRTTYNI
ncbi:hypothetical protein BC829DRAFT_234688 [Chytridium lagenaria]|nr:hypothetical protein BC829DRAFT_234688 [Chytridium lagenaria]